MKTEKSIITIFVISVIALLVFGARTYYGPHGHMTGGMRGRSYVEERANFKTYGHGMMGAEIGCYSMGASGNLEYYLYNKNELNLSINQVKNIESLKNRYFEKNLAPRRELLEKNFELEKVLSAENVDLSRVKSLTNEIANINAELRYNAIESFTRAKNVLTEEQRNRLGAEPFRGHMMN
jgi:hypothetical protein